MLKLKHALIKILEHLCVALFIFISVIGIYQIVARYALSKPSVWSEEFLTYGFTWLALLASALVVGRREHMRLTFVIDRFVGVTHKAVEIFTEIAMLVFGFAIFFYGGIRISLLTFSQITPALQLPMGSVYLIMPIAGCFIMTFSVINIFEIASPQEQGKPGETKPNHQGVSQ